MDYFNYNRTGRTDSPNAPAREHKSETVANRELSGRSSFSDSQLEAAEEILADLGGLELAE